MKKILSKSTFVITGTLILLTILSACTKSNEQLIYEYSQGDEETRTEVVDILISRIESEDYLMRIGAIEAIGIIGDQRAVEPLLEYAESVDTKSSFMKEAIISIGIGSVQPLIEVLRHEDNDMRQMAAELLGEIGHKDAAEALIECLDQENDPTVREELIKAIGNMDAPGATKTLLAVINNPRTYFESSNAIWGIGKYGDTSVISTLALWANWSSDLHHRKGALSSLGQLAGRENIPDILPALKDWDLKEKAYEILMKLEWEPVSEADTVHVWIATKNSSMISANWDLVKEVLLQDVLSRKPTEVQYSLFAFISIGRSEVLGELIRLLDKKGNKIIAEAYLNCGVEALKSAAETWAIEHGYRIDATSEKAPISWGEMDK